MSQSQQTSTGNRGFARGITTRDHRYLRPTFLYQHGPSSESELSSSDDDRYVPPRTTTVASTALLQSQQDLNATSSLSMTHTSLNTRRDNLNVSTFDHSLSSTPQHDSTSQPSTTSQRNSNMGRMRWTYEHNKNLLYAYYKSTEVDSNKKNYLTRLESIWNSLYPSLPFNGNKLSGQVRSILKRNVFTSHQLESIKTQVRNELSHRQSSQVINTQSTDQSIGDNLAATPQLNLDSPVLNLTMPDPNPDVQIFQLHCKLPSNAQGNIAVGANEVRTGKIMFKRGIYQGDPLSSLLFCLCLNPLSNILNTSPFGYKIDMKEEFRVTHLFYMDDLKIYANGEEQLRHLIELVSNFSQSICMSFGLEKCNVLHVKKGKVCEPVNMTLSNDVTISCLNKDEHYKYLGLQQQIKINDSDMKMQYEKQFMKRVNTVMETELNAKNKIQAINAWAIPFLMYTFGIISWSNTDLENLNRKVRMAMKNFRSHHIHSATERLYLPRKDGGRGLLDLQMLYSKQMQKFRNYFINNRTDFMEYFKRADTYTPLKLASSTFTPPPARTTEQLKIDLQSARRMGSQWSPARLITA
ncbi:hypothetical protein M8J76_006261 [Diaphorina citri]|nr:hypothetical protein M8J76_006261 [Diaphorina citri]